MTEHVDSSHVSSASFLLAQTVFGEWPQLKRTKTSCKLPFKLLPSSQTDALRPAASSGFPEAAALLATRLTPRHHVFVHFMHTVATLLRRHDGTFHNLSAEFARQTSLGRVRSSY